MKSYCKIALVGNPNSGKSSLFNQLTGLRQKTGNFPGVTVDKRSGSCDLGSNTESEIIDFPGIYSVYPKSLDEQVVMDVLANAAHESYPDVVVVVVDSANLQRNLLLFTEIIDLNIPVVLALNMLDVAAGMNIEINAVKLAMHLNVPVVRINARVGGGIDLLKAAILAQKQNAVGATQSSQSAFFDPTLLIPAFIADVKTKFGLSNDYLALQYIHQHNNFTFLNPTQRQQIDAMAVQHQFDSIDFQAKEIIGRYVKIRQFITDSVKQKTVVHQPLWTKRLDSVLLHPFWGYVGFMAILLLMFQAVFAWAQAPMDLIDGGIAWLSGWLKDTLPPGNLTELLTDGILAGIGGVLVFIPQIAFLFLLISILEESGYMSRVMVLMDKIMRRFGLNGKSVVPLISGVACAVPAIMAARSISNRKDRLITILVTPLMSCSARLPIFTILIALVVPTTTYFGIISLQALTLLGLYLLGTVSAILTAWALKGIVSVKDEGFFVMEMPTYKLPRWNHVGLTIYDAVKAFVLEAGKIIVAISIVLWVTASYGPGDAMQRAEDQVRAQNSVLNGSTVRRSTLDGSTVRRSTLDSAAVANAVNAQRLEASYAGHFGKFIEPAIKPLGYDWKIGVALLASFAAREVFVGTMSTIYSIGSDDPTGNNKTIKERLLAEVNPDTGKAMYTPALSFSLLIFYVFAMMCMSTIATVYRETKGWKWPAIQFFYMTGLGYLLAYLTYQVLK